MGIRKRRILDRKFQVKAIATAAAIALVSFSFITLLILVFSLKNRADIGAERKRLEKAIETQDNIVNAFMQYSMNAQSGSLRLSIGTVKKDHEESMDAIKRHIDALGNYADGYFILLIAAIVMTIIVIIAHSLYMVRLTHRISGPVFVMLGLIQDMIDGEKPEFRDLRDKDELKELYAKIVELGGIMKGRR
ncbi:MAG: hypothetical protein JXA07_07320 [Spirochaetes bacterium]|nr:hypothetical protein [Spirochaetota bacterium]